MLRLSIAGALILASSAAGAQVTCQTVGTFTNCSNGQSVQQVGPFDLYSNGATGQQLGNTYIYNAPAQPHSQSAPPVFRPMQSMQPWGSR